MTSGIYQRFLLVLLLGAALTAAAHAAPGEMRRACAPDIKAQCGDVAPGGGAVVDCMAAHRDQLSTACKVAIADQRLERVAAKAGKHPASPSEPEAPAQ